MAEAGTAPSLVPYRESVTPPDTLDRCPRKLDFVLLNTATGQVAPARCKANTCAYCAPVNARLIGGAIALAGYQRHITLTQAGDSWQEVRGRMRRLRYFLVKSGFEVEWAWHVEPNPKGTGRHIHAFQRGAQKIPQTRLSSLAVRSGFGRVCWINWHGKRKRAQNYGVKLAGMPYGMKAVEQAQALDEYRELNGNRLVHASRGFWLDEAGRPVGQREAMAAWARLGKDQDEDAGEWQLVPVAHLGRACLA